MTPHGLEKICAGRLQQPFWLTLPSTPPYVEARMHDDTTEPTAHPRAYVLSIQSYRRFALSQPEWDELATGNGVPVARARANGGSTCHVLGPL